jgi:hypothetical protein
VQGFYLKSQINAGINWVWRDTNQHIPTHVPLWTARTFFVTITLIYNSGTKEAVAMNSLGVGTMKRIVRLACVVLSLSLVTASARANSVLDWNVIAVNTAAAAKANPFAQGRYAAIVQLAVFEAVNSITGEYQPYLSRRGCSRGIPIDDRLLRSDRI